MQRLLGVKGVQGNHPALKAAAGLVRPAQGLPPLDRQQVCQFAVGVVAALLLASSAAAARMASGAWGWVPGGGISLVTATPTYQPPRGLGRARVVGQVGAQGRLEESAAPVALQL